MARVQIWEVWIDDDGVPVSGVTVNVYDARTTNHTTLFVDEAGPTTTPNPTTTSNGGIPFWVEEGEYDLDFSGAGVTPGVRRFNALVGGNPELAADQVTATELAADSVGTSELQDDSVDADELTALMESMIGTSRDYAEVLTEETTTSATFVDLATPGPVVTVTVPTNGLAVVLAEVEFKTDNGANAASVAFQESTDLPSGQQILQSTDTAFTPLWTVPDSSAGTASRGLATKLIFPATAGARTYTLQYAVAGGSTGTFKNRKLWVATDGGY